MINLNELKENDIITYKDDICKILGVEPAKGNTQKAHMKTIEQYMELEKIGTGKGTKYKVIKIYDIPKEREDGRKENGKSEASLKALNENRYEQESFFKEDELQLAILWTLGLRAYESGWKETTKQPAYIPSNELYIAIGLCNDFFKGLTANQHYYTVTNSKGSVKKEYYCYKYQADIAFNGLYQDMKNKTITAFTQLKRKKLIDFAYWKQYRTTNGDIFPCNDEQMIAIHERRFDTMEWFNQNHRKQLDNVGDLYTKLSHKEFKEAMDKLNELLKLDIPYFDCYYSCYKVIYSLRAVRKELTNRGFDLGTTKQDFMLAFQDSMKDVVARINEKFAERHIERVEKVRQEHIEKFEMEIKQEETKRGFGKRHASTSKSQFTAMANDELYEQTKGLTLLVIQKDLTPEQVKTQKQINDIVAHNIANEK